MEEVLSAVEIVVQLQARVRALKEEVATLVGKELELRKLEAGLVAIAQEGAPAPSPRKPRGDKGTPRKRKAKVEGVLKHTPPKVEGGGGTVPAGGQTMHEGPDGEVVVGVPDFEGDKPPFD